MRTVQIKELLKASGQSGAYSSLSELTKGVLLGWEKIISPNGGYIQKEQSYELARRLPEYEWKSFGPMSVLLRKNGFYCGFARPEYANIGVNLGGAGIYEYAFSLAKRLPQGGYYLEFPERAETFSVMTVGVRRADAEVLSAVKDEAVRIADRLPAVEGYSSGNVIDDQAVAWRGFLKFINETYTVRQCVLRVS